MTVATLKHDRLAGDRLLMDHFLSLAHGFAIHSDESHILTLIRSLPCAGFGGTGIGRMVPALTIVQWDLDKL